MKMILLATLFAIVFPLTVNASNPQRLVRDLKLPSQAMLEHDTITTPIVATTNYIKTTYAGPTSGTALTLTSFSHQPDVARNITITPTGTTGDVESCVIVVSGTDIHDASISENFTFSADASSAVVGNKAFKTVSSVVWPASCESGGFAATWIIGVGSKMGMNHCMSGAGMGIKGIFGGAADSGTWAASASAVSGNTYTSAGTMDASTTIELLYSQNYQCL